MEIDTAKVLQDHEKRIAALEKKFSEGKKPKGQNLGPLDHFQKLKDEGFFAKERKPQEVFDRLLELGYPYKRLQSLTGAFLKAAKTGVLKRKKVEGGWVYYA